MHTDDRSAGILAILRTLLLLQAGVALLGAMEALAWSAFFGPSASVPALLGVATVAVLLVLRGRVPRLRATRVLLALEAVIIAGWLLDLALAVLLVGAVPPPVAWLTRLALPVAAIALARSARRTAAVPVATPGDPESGTGGPAPDGALGAAA